MDHVGIHTTILWGHKIMQVSHCSGQITVAQLTRSCGPTRSCGLAIWSAILHIVWVSHSSHDCADPHNHPVGPPGHAGQPLFRPVHSRCGSSSAHTIVWDPHDHVGWPCQSEILHIMVGLAILHTIVQIDTTILWGLKIMRVSHCSGQITVAQLTRSCGPTRSCGLAIRSEILHIVWVGHSSHNCADRHNHPVGPQDHAGVSHYSGQITVAQLTRSCGPTRSCGLAIWLAILHIMRVSHSSHNCADPHNHHCGATRSCGSAIVHGQITVGVGLAQLTRSCGRHTIVWAHTIVRVIHLVGNSSHNHAGQIMRVSHCSGQHGFFTTC